MRWICVFAVYFLCWLIKLRNKISKMHIVYLHNLTILRPHLLILPQQMFRFRICRQNIFHQSIFNSIQWIVVLHFLLISGVFYCFSVSTCQWFIGEPTSWGNLRMQSRANEEMLVIELEILEMHYAGERGLVTRATARVHVWLELLLLNALNAL